jgi:hypothetical protein
MTLFEELKAARPHRKPIAVPEWPINGQVHLRRLNARERLAMMDFASRLEGDEATELRLEKALEFIVALLAETLVDDAGDRIFVDASARTWLSQEDDRVLQRLGDEALRFNCIGRAGDAGNGQPRPFPSRRAKKKSRSRRGSSRSG